MTLVTLLISIDQDGKATSDLQTHDNSFADVARGLAAIRAEIDRVFAQRRECPYFPQNAADGKRKIIRGEVEP
jgi:hypothetical protein